MVRLSQIYTKTGDGGRTMLGDGSTCPKHAMRVAAYGDVDEANAVLGAAVVALESAPGDDAARLVKELRRIQNEMFDVGADLCVPAAGDEAPGAKLRVTDEQIERLEGLIDGLNERLEPLNSFVLPGGSAGAAALHHARTVVRRSERGVSALLEAEPERTSPKPLIYLNRLSDLLFVMARIMNDEGRGDVLWRPGGRDPGAGGDGGAGA